jgi:hypothetical protein
LSVCERQPEPIAWVRLRTRGGGQCRHTGAGARIGYQAGDRAQHRPAETAGSIEQRAATVRAGAKDIGATAFSYAEKNVQASLDYAQALLHA